MKFYKYKFRIGLLIGIAALLISSVMFPDTANSDEKYKLERSAISMAGGQAQSEVYSVNDAVGQSSPVGNASSANYRFTGGFLGEVVSGIIVSAPHLSGPAGVDIDVFIYVEDLTSKNVNSLSIVLETEAPLSPLNASSYQTLLDQWSSFVGNIDGNCVTIVSAGANPLTGSGALVKVQYRVDAAAVENMVASIHIAEVLFNEGDPVALPQDGSYTVSNGYKISGEIAYYSTTQPVGNATLNLNEIRTQTDLDGLFTFSDIPGGDYRLTPEKSGDRGNAVGAYDASMILRYAANLLDLSPYQMIAADVTGNGGVTPYDASYILRYVVGDVTIFPTGKEWKFIPASIRITSSNWNSVPEFLTYEPLNADKTDQNFLGLVCGDVSCNWSPPGQQLASLPRETLGTATAQWGEISRVEQNQIKIPICLSETSDIFSAEIKITFDHDILKFRGLIVEEGSEGFVSEYKSVEGMLTVALAGSHPTKISNEFIQLNFEILDSKNNQMSTIKIEDLNLNDRQIQVLISNPDATFNSVVPTSFSLSQNYPNPFNPETTIKYELPIPGKVELKIFDLQGKGVTTLAQKKQTTGRYNVIWNGCNAFGQKVASGVYFYRITIEPDEDNQKTFTKTRKMILLK